MKHVRFNEGKVFIVNINMVYSTSPITLNKSRD